MNQHRTKISLLIRSISITHTYHSSTSQYYRKRKGADEETHGDEDCSLHAWRVTSSAVCVAARNHCWYGAQDVKQDHEERPP